MNDREKVINGLECCLTGLCDQCGYENSDEPGGCRDELMLDALNALKAQQPRVMTLEEVEAATGVDLYLEISTHIDETPHITAATLDGVGVAGVAFYCNSFKFDAYNKRIYGWRCWTSRPTDEQREAEPWE